MFEPEYPEQLSFPVSGWVALEHEIDAQCARALIESRQKAKDAMEFINRSTGQHLHHIKVEIAEAMEKLGMSPALERRLVDEPI